MKTVLAAAIVSLHMAAAFAQGQQLTGRVVAKSGEKDVLFLSFKDQVAADEGRDTQPIPVPVNPDGTFVFPAPLPIGVTIATTPPCIALEAILVTPDNGTPEMDLLALGPTDDPRSTALPKLGSVTRTETSTSSLLWGLFQNTTRTETNVGKDGASLSATAGFGSRTFGASGSLDRATGGVNMGCRDEQKAGVP